MPDRTGFLSYVHADDQAERGRIRQLADDIADQYALISGEPVRIFVDRNDLAWGDNWREKIDIGLNSGLFFIPVITPRFFQSPECRRELQGFIRSATNLGVRELILPLVYVNVLALSQEDPADEAVVLVKTFQWEDWRDLRFKGRKSSGYRRNVARLAQRLVDASQNPPGEELGTPGTAPPGITPTNGDEGEPGTIDLIARGAQAMPELAATINEVAREVATVGEFTQRAADEIRRADQQGQGYETRLTIAKRLAQDLSDPADRIQTLANAYTASLYDADRGITIIIRQAPEQAGTNPEVRQVWDTFSTSISQLAGATNAGMNSSRQLVESLEVTESLSRDLRPVVRKIRQGLTNLIEGAAVIYEWKRLADEASTIIENQHD